MAYRCHLATSFKVFGINRNRFAEVVLATYHLKATAYVRNVSSDLFTQFIPF